jgi:hypothetical protein
MVSAEQTPAASPAEKRFAAAEEKVRQDPAVLAAVAEFQKTISSEKVFEANHPAVNGHKQEGSEYLESGRKLIDAVASSLKQQGIADAPTSKEFIDYKSGATKAVSNNMAFELEGRVIEEASQPTKAPDTPRVHDGRTGPEGRGGR